MSSLARAMLIRRSAPPGLLLLPLNLLCLRTRGITDIQFYREVDQSHLHLVPAQSSMRRFLLKLKEKEKREERMLQLKMAAESEGRETGEDKKEVTGSKKVVVSNYIERSPTDVLRALASHIGRDFTAPDHRFHDDPFLIPYSSGRKRDYIMSKDGGRRTARYVLDNHPELFTNNLIEAQPPIKAFMPKTTFDEGKATLELMVAYMEGYNVVDAATVYRTLCKKGVDVGADTRQALLEMLAFYNESEAKEEDQYLTAGITMEDEKGATQRWKDGGLAEDIYSKLVPLQQEQPELVAQARQSLLCGMARHGQFERAWQMFKECQANGVHLSTAGYNAAICSVPLQEGLSKTWPEVLGLLREIKRPNLDTLISVLKILRVTSTKEYTQSCQLALSVVAEFRGITDLSLGVYKILIQIFCKRTQRSGIIKDILDEIEARDGNWMTSMIHEEDVRFFATAMNVASGQLRDLDLAYRIHALVSRGGNDAGLRSDFGEATAYYRNFLYLVMQREPIDVAMELVGRYTPHSFSPSSEFYKNLVVAIRAQGGFGHLPKLWADAQLSQFAGINKGGRMELTLLFLEVAMQAQKQLLKQQPIAEEGGQQQQLNSSLVRMAREALADVKREPEGRRLPLGQNVQAAPICDAVIWLALRGDNFALADETMAFCHEEVARIPGSVKEETLEEYLRVAVTRDERKAAMRAVLYASELTLSNAGELAAQLNKAFSLDEVEKKQLNQLFAHDTKWQMLM